MNNPVMETPPELEVSNFGPIVEAKIDLRPLTVFVGPSNTGKSYLAVLVYALHKFFSSFSRSRLFRIPSPQSLSSKTIVSVNEWIKANKGEGEKGIVLSGQVTKELGSLFDSQGDQFGNEIIRCFGMDSTGALIRKGKRNDADVVFRRKVSNDSAQFEHKIDFKSNKTEFGTTIPEGMSLPIDVKELLDCYRIELEGVPHQRDREQELLVAELIGLLTHRALPQLGGSLYRPAFYLPADRTGLMNAHRVVVSSLINRAARADLRRDDPLPDLSGVVADFLNQLVELGDQSERLRNTADALAKDIEQGILKGLVQIKRTELGYPQFFYIPAGWKNALPLMNASSMVSELAPVVFYLRHVVQPGETLIIEEPESHLHPAMQVEFTRQLAALVKAGVRVIVTTHSEWVLEELANIVRRSELPPARKKDGAADVALSPDQVGAWLFKPKSRPKGSVVEEVKLDEESGLYPTDYDSVSEALYNESVSIFNRLQSGDSE